MKKEIIAVILVLVIIAVGIVAFVVLNNGIINNSDEKETREAFVFETDGQEIKMGENFLDINLPEQRNIYEVQSCAFDGIERTYTYENFEITTCPKENEEKILDVYFLNGEVSTKEGLKIGNTADEVKQIYGNNYQTENASFIYTRGNTTLTFIFDNNIITSIEYSLIID